ncbi:MAG TPA: biopolymer transporter ExbD [Abditibacterium sp.]
MQFKKRRELKKTRIEIIPMIDTMFFLLVFFMLSSLALSKLNGLPVNLPQSQTSPRQAPVELTLTIDKNQQLFVNKTAVSFANLEEILVEKAGGQNANLSTATVVVNADTSVPHGVVVRAIDGARAVGIVKFSIATAPEDEAPR